MDAQLGRNYYRRRKQALKQERQPYESNWRELSDNFAPFRGRWISETAEQRKPRSTKKIIDPTPLLAALQRQACWQGLLHRHATGSAQ